jgi:hypothetical protein
MGKAEAGFDIAHCIEQCLNCYRTCLGMAFNHCLERGGRHVAPRHFRLMFNCAQLCRATAEHLLTAGEAQQKLCAACAELCEACAQSCQELDMAECVRACRACAESCRHAAGGGAERAALLQPAAPVS